MLKRFAPLVPLALVTLLIGCAAQGPVSQPQDHTPVASQSAPEAKASVSSVFGEQQELATEDDLQAFSSNSKPYQLPVLADSILERGMSLIGTRYRFGGTSQASGFDCSGFIGYLFREEAGMNLPRSTREMIKVDAPKVARNKLKPGDLLFFSTNGRGRVSHAGIYLGDNQFIHSSSRRSGGVRIDNLGDRYWSKTFIEAKRALAMAPASNIARN
ncbi:MULTISPECIES: C40 family peptidase [Pseudomonas]|jgi:cell wall-associated NlpC family hydrolase|uniref:C40 family peptidase n=1 Tax=Pseudomonas putida TaxID=303 RepID=A0A379KEW9_PSEPU|nr:MULTISPECIES: C40 family peptidase [Pseudomonas]QPN46680.1 C40 family peptidase [Priestia aryabhattai]KAF1312812.1 peptidase P60 [Pseudomonas sp. SG-MS2]MBG6124276.1 cell wall-associated NlpC family hydrolase [Pseudomonas sp. M2]NSX21715.1 C40 family peptidase [Pseudomonas putida]NWC79814.1 C40 family peptidase [Pseudomonas putida]